MSKHNHNYSQHYNKNPQNPVKIGTVEVNELPKITPVNLAMGHPDPVGEPGAMGVTGENVANVESVKPQFVNETVETKSVPKTVDGMVVGCAKLNVRAEASLFSDVICTLNAQSEIEIDVEKSNRDWFYICTATGIEGYCMRKYVEAHL